MSNVVPFPKVAPRYSGRWFDSQMDAETKAIIDRAAAAYAEAKVRSVNPPDPAA